MMIPEFVRWLERQQRLASTVRSYPAKVELFLAWLATQGKTVPQADADVVFAFLEHLTLGRKQAANTRRTYMFALRSYFDFLVEKQVVPENYAKTIAMPKRAYTPPGNLSEEEIAKLMHAAFENKTEKGMRDLAIISVMAGTGCRVSALSNLRLSDFRTTEITVPERCQYCQQSILSGRFAGRGKKVKATMVRLKEKGAKTWDVLLPEKASFYLSQYLTNRKDGFGSEIVFPTKYGKKLLPINRTTVVSMLRKYAAKAGVTAPVNPHMFRHAAITWWLDYGVDPETVQRMVGHAALAQTLEYRHRSMRSYVFSGISGEKNLLENMPTPMDVLFKRRA